MLYVLASCLALFGVLAIVGWRLARSSMLGPVRDWFRVTIDGDEVHLNVDTATSWRATFRFDDIIRVCVKIEPALGTSHGVYVWVRGRESSHAVPLDATGGRAFFDELIRRGLFPDELAKMALTRKFGTYCHPDNPS